MQTILFLAANPKDTGRLRLDQELRDIAEGLQRAQKRDQFNLEPRLAVRPRDIQRAMLDVEPQIIHFSGHGEGDQGLVFEDEIGNAKRVDGAALAELFKLFADQVACVVLNACYSEAQAKAIAQHIPYVIGMNQAIGDKAAIAFAVGFYDALGAGRPIEFAYKLGCSAIRMEGIEEHLTPVLLKQSTTGDAIVQPKPAVPSPNLPAIVEELLPLIQSIAVETLTIAFRACFPEGFDRSIPDTAEACLLMLVSLPEGETKLIPRFIKLLLPEKQRPPLIDPENISNATDGKTETYLMVQVRGHQQDRGKYVISASVVDDPAPETPDATLCVPHLIEASDTSFVEEEIWAEVSRLVGECCREHGVSPAQLMVQCFLPIHLLHAEIEQKVTVKTGRNEVTRRAIATRCKAVVLRSLERQKMKGKKSEYCMVVRDWETQWRTLMENPDASCRDVMNLEQEDMDQFDQALDRAPQLGHVGCGFVGLADPMAHEERFDQIFAVAAYPIALWLRPTHNHELPYAVLQSHLSGSIGELPFALTARRREPIGAQHVTLLWDNPFRPFPDIDYQSKSA